MTARHIQGHAEQDAFFEAAYTLGQRAERTEERTEVPWDPGLESV